MLWSKILKNEQKKPGQLDVWYGKQ